MIDDAPAQDSELVGNIGKMVLWGLIFFSAMEKKAKPNLIILLVFLVALGLWGVPWGDGWVVHHCRRVIVGGSRKS